MNSFLWYQKLLPVLFLQLFKTSIFALFFSLCFCVCACMRVCAYVLSLTHTHEYGHASAMVPVWQSEDITQEFCPSTVWVLQIELRVSG